MVLTIIGAFGHSVFGGLRLALFGMLDDSARAQYTAALDRTYDSPVMLFAAMGLLGTLFGLLLWPSDCCGPAPSHPGSPPASSDSWSWSSSAPT